jgi:hypothetical protein
MSSIVKLDHTWDGQPTQFSYSVEYSLSAINGDMQIVINAPFHNDSAPSFAPGKVENMQDYEAVDVFISGFPYSYDVAETPYLEIQVGPHGHYFLAFFMREADWPNQDITLDLLTQPKIGISHSTNRWHATIAIPSYFLPEPRCGDNFAVEWKTNVCAIFGSLENRQYLSANRLPGTQPNFHQLACFSPIQLFETLEMRATVDRTKSIAHDKMSLALNKHGSATKTVPFNVTEELRRAVLEESLLAVEGQKGELGATSNVGNNYRGMSVIAEEENESLAGAPSSATVPNSSHPSPPPVATVEQVARQIRERLLRSDLKGSALEDLDEACQRHLLQDEFVILHSIVWKRRGISFKKRRLIFTSKPRLLYATLQGEFKGQVAWSLTKCLNVVKRADNKFDIIPSEGNRTYHFSDSNLGADVWIDVLNSIMQAQKQYLVASRTA